jgi:hypothetical protein
LRDAEINISDRDTTLNGKFLLELTESMRGEVTFSLLQDETEIAKTVCKVAVRVPDSPEIELRTGGGRTLEEVPLNEIAALMDMVAKQFSIHEEEQLFREVLDRYKIKRLTSKARSILEAARKLIPT